MSGWLGRTGSGAGGHQQRVAEVGGQVDQRAVQGIPRRPGLTRLLPSLKVFDRSGRTAQRTGGALAGTAGAQRGPQLLGLGFVAPGGQYGGFGFCGGDQRLGGAERLRPCRRVTGQPQRLLAGARAPPGRWPAVAPVPRGRH